MFFFTRKTKLQNKSLKLHQNITKSITKPQNPDYGTIVTVVIDCMCHTNHGSIRVMTTFEAGI